MKLQELTNPQLFVDLDGVLADFISGASKALNMTIDEDLMDANTKEGGKYRNIFWSKIAKYSKEGGKLWGELGMMPDGMILWNYVKKHNPTILTASGNPVYGAESQKHDWVNRKLGKVPTVVVRLSKDKSQYAQPNAILIDDRTKSIKPWVDAGGVGILHTNASDTIDKLKQMGIE